MLALNMSKEVLSAFGILNKKLLNQTQLLILEMKVHFAISSKAVDQPGQFGTKGEKNKSGF
jgi:hypothetical protein